MKRFIPLLALLIAGCAQIADTKSTLVQNVQVIDGTGGPGHEASVRIAGGLVVEIGNLTPTEGELIVEGNGMVLSPGFIDTHSHDDWDDRSTKPSTISQGITTIVVGQDGGSRYPLSEFFDSLRVNPLAVNIASYSGHNTLRGTVMGEDFDRRATNEELMEMRQLLTLEMRSGALGLSTGLEYDPGIYSSTEEVIVLAQAVAAYGGRYISHIRSEDRYFEAAIEEIIRIGKEAEIPVQIGHLKLARRGLWGSADSLLIRLDEVRSEGVDITADVYPYEYWQSTMTVLFPERNFSDRDAAEYALTELVAPDEMIIGYYELDSTYVGQTLADLAILRDTDPVTTYMDMIAETQEAGAGESIIARSMIENDIMRLLQWPHTNVSSDGSGPSLHPRGHGSFPRVLSRFVRDLGAFSLEEAVHKMTGLSAEHVGLRGRGVLTVGAPADLVLFDPLTVADRATFEEPHLYATGINRVWVNGVVVYVESEVTGLLPGEVLVR